MSESGDWNHDLVPEHDSQDRESRVARLLVDNIHTELLAQNALMALDLPEPALARMARGIADEVLYAFAIDWSPRWLKPGEIHSWESSGKFFARCPACLEDSPPCTELPNAVAWARRHHGTHDA